jgi:hypothetical protein
LRFVFQFDDDCGPIYSKFFADLADDGGGIGAIGDVESSASARAAEVGGTNKYSHDLNETIRAINLLKEGRVILT